MDNKIKLEDTCLTVEQAKELQELGVDMSDSIMVYCDYYDQVHDYELLMNNNLSTSYAYEVVNTLTNTEILEMLPPKFVYHDKDAYLGVRTDDDSGEYEFYYKRWINDCEGPMFHNKLIRDSLFEMIKYLKINHII